ncbi:MAG: SRPBCC domain-containing protein [Leptolyngbya sp.]|nr:SRPBCC domain-containing protein [Candidatus Melainabacteria bacterium]
MMQTKNDLKTVEIARTLKAPVDKVYKAWTESEQMTRWLGCVETGTVKVTQNLHVGGEYRFEITLQDGKEVLMYGIYKEVETNRKLVYTWTNNSEQYPAKDTIVTVEFIAKGDLTELVLKHANLTEIAAQGHTFGWSASFDKFEKLFI